MSNQTPTALLRKSSKIALLFVFAAFFTALTTSPSRADAGDEADKKIEVAVMQQLANSPNLYAKHIKVSVRRGVVTLSGFVMGVKDLDGAKQSAARVPGVTSVIDQMKVETPGSGGGGG